MHVEVPVLGRELRVPYAYRNGALNLVKPQPFPESEERAASVAARLALQGDLLYRHKGEDGGQFFTPREIIRARRNA